MQSTMPNPIKALKSKLSLTRGPKGDKGDKPGKGKPKKTELAKNITKPADFDILLGRGKTSFNHVGNRRFRVFINLHLRRYMDASTRMDKTVVVNSVVEAIHEAGGRFLKEDLRSKSWYQVATKTAREKVGHALRDAVGMRLKMANNGGANGNGALHNNSSNNNSHSTNHNSNSSGSSGVMPGGTVSMNPTMGMSMTGRGGTARERRKSDIAQVRAKRSSLVERPSLLLSQDPFLYNSKSCNDVTRPIEPVSSLAADAQAAILELQQESLQQEQQQQQQQGLGMPLSAPTSATLQSAADSLNDTSIGSNGNSQSHYSQQQPQQQQPQQHPQNQQQQNLDPVPIIFPNDLGPTPSSPRNDTTSVPLAPRRSSRLRIEV